MKRAPLAGTGPEHEFGWAIGTSTEDLIKAHAEEHGIEADDAFWEQINADISRLESNCQAVIEAAGAHLRNEGHSDYDLVGTGWLREGGKMWRLWRDMGNQEVARSYDILPGLFPAADGMLWGGISEHGKSLLDVDFRFLDDFPGEHDPHAQEEAQQLVHALIGRDCRFRR